MLLEFLRRNPSFFEKGRWHSPFMMEQISRRWWEATDIMLKAVREDIGDEEMAEQVKEMLYIKDIK